MPTPVPANLLPSSLRAPSGKAVPTALLPEGLRPQKEAAGFLGSFGEAVQTLGLADEAATYASNPTEENRRAFLNAAESKYRKVGFGEGENWEAFKELLGGSLGQLVAPVAAGVGASFVTTPVGGLVAAGTTGATQYTTQNLLRQAQAQEEAIAEGRRPEDVSVGKAVAAATGQTALDLLAGPVFGKIAKAFPFMRPLLGEGSKKAVQEAGEVLADAAKQGTIQFVGGVAKGVGKGVAFEVPQEIAQQGLERWQAGLSLTDDEALGEYKQAAIGAALLGGGFGGVNAALPSRRAEVAPEAGAEEAIPQIEITPTTKVDREAIFSRLKGAAGEDISAGANAGVRALERRVSNDLAFGTPESLADTDAYLTEQEDRIAAGEYPEDIAEPLINALAEARRVVAEYTTPEAARGPSEDIAGEPPAPISERLGAGVPPVGEPGRVRPTTSSVGGVDAGPVGISEPSVVPPTVGPVAEPDTLISETTAPTVPAVPELTTKIAPTPSAPEVPELTAGAPEVAAPAVPELTTEVPEPTVAPVRTEMKTASDWLVNFADRYGQAPEVDAWVKTNLGYETLPEALETTGKLERSATQQAGQERLLQRNKINPIIDLVGKLDVNLGDFGLFLWARDALERNPIIAERNADFPEGGAGLTTAQANETLNRFKEEGVLPKFNQLAKKADELVDYTLEQKVKAGLLSGEEAKAMREAQPSYMPLKGFAADGDMLTADVDDDANGPDRREQAMRALRSAVPTGSVDEYRKAFGRGSMPFHPLFNLFQDAEQATRRAVMNEAAQPILRAWKVDPKAFEGIMNVYTDAQPKRVMMGRDIPGGRFEPVPDMKREYYSNPGKYLLVKDKGVAHYIEFNEEGPGAEIKRMFANMRPQDMQGATKTIANVNNFMKGMLTYKNPLYLLFVAPFRDTSDAIATAMYHQNLKGSPAYKKNLASKTFLYAINPTTWSTLARFVFGKAPLDSQTGALLEEMIAAGGATLHTRFLDVQEKANVAQRAIKELQGIENLSPKERGAKLWEGLNYWLDGLADIMDMSGRFATYRAATDLGIKSTDAARLALDSSLNLTRRGEKARSLDLVFPFFGAAVEGSRKTVRIMRNPKSFMKVFGALIAYGVMESLWNAMMSGDSDDDGQDDYLDLDQGASLRMSRVTIYYGDGPDDYIKVPIGQMLGYFKFVGNKIGDVMAGTATPSEATEGLIPGFFSLMSPVRVPSADLASVTTAFTPLIGKPFMENIMNENFFGSPIYQRAYEGSGPRSELGRASTGEPWKEIAKAINQIPVISGGSAAVSGKLDFQPEAYRHIIEGYFGGPYQLAKQLVGLKEAEGVADVPGIKSFKGTGSEYTPQSKYFENSNTVRQIMSRLAKLPPEEQAKQGEKFFVDTDPRVIAAYKAVESNLDRINKEQRASLETATTPEDKQLVLDYYREQKNQYYSAFNSIYNDAKREQ